MSVTRTVVADRLAKERDRELAQSTDAALERARRAASRRKAQPEPEPEAPPVAPKTPVAAVAADDSRPVTFVCNAVPALGVGLGDRMYMFQNGVLTVEVPEHVAAMRKHEWFGRRIFERVDMPAEADDELDAEEDRTPQPVVAKRVRLREGKGSLLAAIGLSHIMVKETSLEGDIYRCALCKDLSPVFHAELDLARHAQRLHRPIEQGQKPLAKRIRTDVRG